MIFKINPKVIANSLLLMMFFLAPALLARPDFDVHPRDIERRLSDRWAFRDTLRIDNSRDHDADEVLEWHLTLDPPEQEWLRVYLFGGAETTELQGEVDPGEAQRVVVVQRGDNLEEGHYYVNIEFTSNDPTREEFTVPVAGHTADYPRITTGWANEWGDWWGIDMNNIFGEIFYGDVKSFNLNVNNPNNNGTGGARLVVEDIQSDNGYWVIEPDSFGVDPGQGQQIRITFTAEEIDQNSATITSISNAWNPRELSFRIVASVSPVFRMIAALPDTTVDEDSGEILMADLESVFLSSNWALEYEFSASNITGRIARNGEFFIRPVSNYFGEEEVIISAIDGDSVLSDTFLVTVNALPDSPLPFDLISPAHDDTIRWDSADSMFVWQSSNDADGDTVYYSLSLWLDNEDPREFLNLTDTTLSINVLDQVLNPEMGGMINWTVTATDGEHTTSAWSVFRNYVVSNSVANENRILPDGIGLINVYPNPFNSILAIEINLKKSSPLKIEIFDSQGRFIDILSNTLVAPGNSRYSWHPENLSSGNYHVRVSTGTAEVAYPVILSK